MKGELDWYQQRTAENSNTEKMIQLYYTVFHIPYFVYSVQHILLAGESVGEGLEGAVLQVTMSITSHTRTLTFHVHSTHTTIQIIYTHTHTCTFTSISVYRYIYITQLYTTKIPLRRVDAHPDAPDALPRCSRPITSPPTRRSTLAAPSQHPHLPSRRWDDAS
jgi:hypothetical protein